ncbi:molybdate ABC transporter, periplasmic molybdate-binding protein, partial [Vibrio parahaemolyticus V-223/04]
MCLFLQTRNGWTTWLMKVL